MSKKFSWSVVPTYAAGSPAQVDEATAVRVAVEEANVYQHALDGIYGEATRAAAVVRGREGIVYQWREARRGAEVYDQITGIHLSFKTFPEFQAWGARMRALTKAYQEASR